MTKQHNTQSANDGVLLMRIPSKMKKRLEQVARQHEISAARYIRLALEIPLRLGVLPTYGEKQK